MKNALAILSSAVALAWAAPAVACAPPPPGWVPPTPQKLRSTFVGHAPAIVYGIVVRDAAGTQSLRIHHVYRGDYRVGDRIAVTSTHDFPVGPCVGMMPPPPPKPVGTYGVFGLQPWSKEPVFIPMDQVRAMIDEGLIRSAQAG